MIPAFILALFALLGTYSASGNFAADLNGPLDGRPGTWGTAEAQTWPVKFFVPDGYRVRIVAIQGDLLAMPRTMPEDAPVTMATLPLISMALLAHPGNLNLLYPAC